MNQTDRKEIFEKLPIPKALWKMALPTVISQLINLFYNIVDTFFIGRTGNSYMVAGITLSFTVFMMTISFSNLFGIGGGSLVARLMGRREEEEAKNICSFAIYGAAAIALLYSLIVGVFLNPILRFLGASDQTIGYARQYVLLVVVIGNLPVILSTSLAHLLRNAGLSKQASIGLSGGGILNMALDPLFMFVLFPKGMEVFGAALATLLSNIISLIYLLITLQKASHSSPLSLDIMRIRQVRKQDIRELFSVGIPSALLTTMVDVSNVFMNILMSAHGDLQLAAVGIVMKAERLPVAVNIGICQGMLPIVAYNYSAKCYDRMREAIKTARNVGLWVSIVSIAIFEIFANPIARLFLSTKSAVDTQASDALLTIGYAALFLRIRVLCSPFKLLNFHSSYCLQAIGDGKSTLIHSVFRELAFHVPLMYLLNGLFGLKGLVSAIVVGETLGATVALILLNRSLKKRAIFEKPVS